MMMMMMCVCVCVCVGVQANTFQLAKENIERSCSDYIDAAERRAELREAELNKQIMSLEARRGT